MLETSRIDLDKLLPMVFLISLSFINIANNNNMEDDTDPPILWRLVELTLNLNRFTVPSQGFEAGALIYNF